MAKIVCLANDDVKAYALLDLQDYRGDVQHLHLSISADDGERYPGEVFPYADEGDEDSRMVVLVFPLIPRSIWLGLFDESSSDEPVFDIRIRPSFLKLESRIDRRLNPSRVRRIRGIDERGRSSQASLCVHDVFSDGDADIVRFTLSVPESISEAPQIKIYDSRSQLVDCSLLYMGSFSRPWETGSSVALKHSSYSVRLPHTSDSYTIEVSGVDGGASLSINPLMKEAYLLRFKYMTENAQACPRYGKWLGKTRPSSKELSSQKNESFDVQPLVSIVSPVYNVSVRFLKEMIESVRDQTYPKWELILINASPDNRAVSRALRDAAEADDRIKVIALEENLGITRNTARGIDAARGEFVSFLDHDDMLEPNALFEYVKAINEDPGLDILYCDEDKISDGRRYDPYFKPDLSLFLLREINYICHFLMIRRSLLEQVDYADSRFDGAQDHNLVLQCVEKSARVRHIPKVLYIWRASEGSTACGTGEKPYADTAGRLAIEEHLKRCGIEGSVEGTSDNCRYHVRYDVIGDPLVSIIIPNKDNVDVLSVCIDSILAKSTYRNFEIIVIENNSKEDRTFEYYDELEKSDARIRVIAWPDEFNYSKINNFGAAHANGEFLLLLNNDTEVLSPDWLETMLGLCQQREVGAVGVKLLYPDMRIQHAGVYVQGDGAGHLALNLARHDRGYFSTVRTTRELSAVTAACMMVKRAVFEEIGGFDPRFAVAFNDTDLCMKIREAGCKVIYTPLVEMIHYESISRGYEDTPEKISRFNGEVALLMEKWESQYAAGDPYMNRNLKSDSNYYALDAPDYSLTYRLMRMARRAAVRKIKSKLR